MTKIIQITDAHIVPEGQLAYDKVDTAAALTKAVDHINHMLPQIGPVDLAIFTGDLTDFGTEDEYSRFRSIMERLAIPYLAVPGNHDDRETMRAGFADQDWMPSDGPINWMVDLPDFAVVGLDTRVPDAPHGHLSEESLDFLKKQLVSLTAKPVLVGLHHPPFLTGIHGMDIQPLRDAGPLRKLLSSHPSEVRLVCGHVHRAVTTLFGDVICLIAPGTSHAVTLEQRPERANSLTMEPSGFMLHEWRDGFVSHSIPIGTFEGPYPFLAAG